MFITTSTLPCVARGPRSARATTASWSAMSATRGGADPAAGALDLGDDLVQSAGCRSGEHRSAARAAASAVARPMPLAAPVIRQRRSRRSFTAAPPEREVGLDAQRVQRHRQHLVVADEHAELDQLDLVELGRAAAPRARRRSRPSGAARRRGEQHRLPRRPAGRLGAVADPSICSAPSPACAADPHVVAPLVLAAGVVGDAEDHQLGVLRGSLPPGHQRPGEPEPAPEQPRWRASVVKMRGGRPPVAMPSNLAIPALTRPIWRATPGADPGRLPCSHPGRRLAQRLRVFRVSAPCLPSTRPRCCSALSTRCRKRSSGRTGSRSTRCSAPPT